MAINAKKPGDLGYVCFYNGERIEVYAQGTYNAQELARQHFQNQPKYRRRRVKGYDVTVVLAEDRDGKEVVHTAVD